MSQAQETTQHTPGPWSVYTPKNNDGFGVDGPKDEYGDKQIVCYSVTTQANARLIAAAPELLGALRMLLVTAGEINDAPDSLLEMALESEDQETRNQAIAHLCARAAIAKATA